MKHLLVLLSAGAMAVVLQAAPAWADCKSEITRMSRAGILSDPRAISEYQAAQVAAGEGHESECRTHLDNAYNYQRAGGRRGSAPSDDGYRYDRNSDNRQGSSGGLGEALQGILRGSGR